MTRDQTRGTPSCAGRLNHGLLWQVRAHGISERLRWTGEARPSQNRADENSNDSGPPALAHDVPVAVMPSRRQVAHREGTPGRSSRVQTGQPIDRIRQRRLGLLVERTAWTFGSVCLVTCGAVYIDGARGARHELERFALLQAAALPRTPVPDLSLWDPERITAWRRALSEPAPPPLAVLRIPKIRLEVPVLPGTDDLTLNRAVGHIDDTALPGTDGNSGIAGHRDGFFRGLKDIGPEDAIELETLRGKGSLSRRTDLGRRPGGRICARPNAGALTDAGHVLSVLLRRPSAATLHRPRRTCRYRTGGKRAVEQVSGVRRAADR